MTSASYAVDREPVAGHAREALLAGGLASVFASAVAWLAPPGADMAAHMYQRTLFLRDGFSLWNNFWYAGRYSFVNYSLLYYPVSALVGIRALAVATVAVGAAAFALVTAREWGPVARWSSRTFAVTWCGVVLTGAFPFLLGVSLALLALWALQRGRRVLFAGLLILSVAASPLAFLLLCVILAAVAVERRSRGMQMRGPAAVVLVLALAELMLWRAFPSGRYPFSLAEASASWTFCLIGLAVTWRVEQARLLRAVFLLYLAACIALFLVPTGVGENIARIRFASIPLTVLVLSLRRWRPWPVALLVLLLASSWNLTPLASDVASGAGNPAAEADYWQPAIAFLKRNLPPSYRVEAVDTQGHWPAVYLARAKIPLARGWFRQDDFPQNRILYERLDSRTYLAWLRRLGVLYVVVAQAPTDYSARAEEELIASGRSGLHPTFRTPALAIYRVPRPRSIVVGPGRPRVLALTNSSVVLRLDRPGRYRVSIRSSPYWKPSSGCLSSSRDGMLRLSAPRAGTVRLHFAVDAGRVLDSVAGESERVCADHTHG